MMALYTGSFAALRGSAWMTITDVGPVIEKPGQERYTRCSSQSLCSELSINVFERIQLA
jgi:hypothetical protein